MSRSRPLLLVAGLSALLGACSAPAVAPKPFSSQTSGTHIQDWDRVAARIADGLTSAGYLPSPTAASSAQGASRPAFHVHVAADGSTFLTSVKQALEGEILRRGGTVQDNAVDTVVVNLDVDVVGWGPRANRPGGVGTTVGAASGLGIILANAAPITPLEGAAAVLSLGVASDIIEATVPRFGAEAAWRAIIYNGDRLVFQVREPMYVHAADLPLYRGDGRLAHIPSGAAQPQLRTVQVRYAR